MKTLLFFLCLVFTAGAAAQQPIRLIPQPVSVVPQDGSFSLTNVATIGHNTPAGRFTAEMLARHLGVPTGYALKAQQTASGSIQLNINASRVPLLGDEGYSLDASAGGVVIAANTAAGLYYGMQTLIQLLPPEIESRAAVQSVWTVPGVKITDYPRFPWRGIMLDVSRNFFTKDEVKHFIDQISRYKYNTFHWHLTDDEGWRIEITSLPRLTSVGAWRVPRIGYYSERAAPLPGEKATHGGFYTQEDIREVVRFAQERNVTIVPEIDVPGHSMAVIAAYPELSCRKDTTTTVNPGAKIADWFGNGTFRLNIENTLNPSDEKVYEFLGKVFGEVAALFPGSYIHVGGDECYKGYWAQDAGCKALMKRLNIRHVEDLQGYFMNRVEKILKANGKKLLGWDEILDGGISPEASVMSWRGVKGGIEAAKMGHNVVMSPTTFAYLDYTQGDPSVDPPVYSQLRARRSYSFEPIPEELTEKEATHILGGQGNLWTEQLPTMRSLEYMLYPRAWALSEVYWSPKSAKNWANFVPRMEAHFTRAEAAEINSSRAVYDAIVKPTVTGGRLMLELDTEVSGIDVYYTIDGTMPDRYSPKYSKPAEIPEGPVTLRVITYRGTAPIGHLITLKRDELMKRAVR